MLSRIASTGRMLVRGQSRLLPRACTAAATSSSSHSLHTLPELPYDYSALAPVISGEIMELHHKKHHNTYVTNLNAAEEALEHAVEAGDISAMIALQPALKFNGGGHINHTIFWQNLSPQGGGEPGGELMSAINKEYGSFDEMKAKLTAATVGIQGSGWGWLGYNTGTRTIQIATCANQDPLQATTRLTPLFGIDVWEHAYYLQYKNVRPDYVKAIFNIANWEDVERRYNAAMTG